MYFWMRILILGKNSPVGVLLILSLSSVSVQSQVLKRVLLDCDDHSVEEFFGVCPIFAHKDWAWLFRV